MMKRELTEALHKAIDFPEKNRLAYSVVGGIAASQWGFVRATYDVDIKVVVPNSDYEGTASLLRKEFPQKARVNLPPNPLIVSVTSESIYYMGRRNSPTDERTSPQAEVEKNMTTPVVYWQCLKITTIASRNLYWRPINTTNSDSSLKNLHSADSGSIYK